MPGRGLHIKHRFINRKVSLVDETDILLQKDENGSDCLHLEVREDFLGEVTAE